MTERYRRTRSGNLARVGVPKGAKMRRLKVAVFTRDDFTCRDCGRRSEYVEDDYDGTAHLPDLTLGHIVSHRDGGNYSVENLRAECPPCNYRKGARICDAVSQS